MTDQTIATVNRRLADWFRHRDPAPALVARHLSDRQGPPPRRRALGTEEAETQLRALLRRLAPVAPERINFIGLGQIRRTLGAAWPAWRDQAHDLARKIISRRLGTDDAFLPWGEDGFVVIIRSPELARLKCAAIGRDIAASICGRDGAGRFDVKVVTETAGGGFDFEEWTLDDDVGATGRFREPHTGEPHKDERSPQDATVPAAGPRVDFAYRPVWDPARSMIAAHFCLPRLRTTDGCIDAMPHLGTTPRRRAALDIAVLRQILSDLEHRPAGNARAPVILPVAYSTLADRKTRSALETVLERIDRPATHHLVVELVDVPTDVSARRLGAVILPVRPHCDAVIARAGADEAMVARLADGGGVAIGIDVSAPLGPTSASITSAGMTSAGMTSAAIERLQRFRRLADDVEVPTYVHGAHAPQLAMAAVAEGYDFIDGEAIAGLVASPWRGSTTATQAPARPKRSRAKQ